jgi:anti-sigma factor RsiW
MMAGNHPSDLELLEHVEGELDQEAADTLRAHIASCDACATAVAALERARSALHSSPLLELSARRRELILAGLPKQERERRPLLDFLSSPRRLVYVLAPVAAVAIAVVALTSTLGDGGGGRDAERSAEAPPPAEAAPEAAQAQADAGAEAGGATGGAAEEAAPAIESAVAPVVSVAGPPEEVVASLREEGLQAKVVNGAVEVTGATAEAVRRALEGRPRGDVPVYVR